MENFTKEDLVELLIYKEKAFMRHPIFSTTDAKEIVSSFINSRIFCPQDDKVEEKEQSIVSLIPNCSQCKYHDSTGGLHLCIAQGYQFTSACYGNENCKELYMYQLAEKISETQK